MVDKRSQRAAWAFADGEHPKFVFETSLFNLTNDQATMMVLFGPKADETEVWNLVRMEQPDASGMLPGNPPPPSRIEINCLKAVRTDSMRARRQLPTGKSASCFRVYVLLAMPNGDFLEPIGDGVTRRHGERDRELVSFVGPKFVDVLECHFAVG